MSITLLPKSLQNQIAAGEVVENPASVVKEVIENSIDSGADDIGVEIEEGGIQKIRIIDNGSGIEPQDLPLVMTRYATSKITTVEDLFALHSFGFRGEAIASIASVSRYTLRSHHVDSSEGYEIHNYSTENIPDILPVSCPKGTESIIENLFWNTPARRKFLKSPATESRSIAKVIENFALSHPHISFRFQNNGKEVFFYHAYPSSDTSSALKRYQEVLGGSVSESFLSLEYLGKQLSLSGVATHPNFHRSVRDRQYVFVNNRIITKDKHIHAAISQAYKTLLPNGKHPSFVLHLTLDPEMVDVNVHPRKTEVRFEHPKEVFRIVKECVQRAISLGSSGNTHSSVPISSVSNAHTQLHRHEHEGNTCSSPSCSSPFPSGTFETSSVSVFPSAFPTSPASDFSKFSSSIQDSFLSSDETTIPENSWKVVGQIRKSFIILEESKGVRIIDQHAAHERVRIEHLMEKYEKKEIQVQPLLTPVVFSISHSEKMLLESESERLHQAGFEIGDFGGNEIAIHAVPAGSEHVDIQKLFLDLLSDMDFFDPSYSDQRKSFAHKALAYSACRGAKKFGDELSFPEMEQLISDWKECKYPDSCAHGRPVSVFYPYKTLENECGRY